MIKQLFVLLVAISTSAYALPLPKLQYSEQSALNTEISAGYDFEGIVALNNCSGSIVRFTRSLDDDKAMVMTNGHCLANMLGGGMPEPGEVIVNKSVSRKIYVLNPADGTKIGEINAEKILYATMTKTDMTLYSLRQTYKEIKDRFNVRPLMLSEKYATIGDGIDVVSGFWKKGYTCQVEMFVNILKEDKWTMNESIRYTRPGCETIGGTSGSPVISRVSREVIGINNTANEDGEKCTMNNPCEMDAKGAMSFEKGFSYGQQTSWLYSCLTSENVLDLTKTGCQLPH